MYTAQKVIEVSKSKPSQWKVETVEDIDILITYRYGFIFIEVDKMSHEMLHKTKLTTDVTDSYMSWEDFLEYAEEYLPKEMIDFSLIKHSKNEED